MKQYDVTLTGHYEKTISVYADSPEQAAEKLKIILFDTDLIDFSDEDFVCGEADIGGSRRGRRKEIDPSDDEEDECLKHEDCSECPYFCPMWRMPSGGRGLSNVLPSTEFWLSIFRWTPNSLVRDAPNTP